MPTLYERVTQIGLSEGERSLSICDVFSEFTRLQRGTRTAAEVKAAMALTDAQLADAMGAAWPDWRGD